MRHLTKLLLLITILLFALPAFAQSATETPQPTRSVMDTMSIALGDTVRGSLTADDPALTYRLDAEAGQRVTITLTSDAVDTYLTLLDGDGQVLAQNDDSNGTDSAITGFMLPTAASYQILVESYAQHSGSGAETGSFSLTAAETSATVAVIPTVSNVGSIGLGDTVTGSLTSATTSMTYTLEAEAGQSVTVTLASSDFDTYLSIMDGSGNVLTQNDDSDGTNSGIHSFVLPQASSYQILVESYAQHNGSGAVPGDFTLSASEQQVAHIEYTQTVEDSFTSDALVKDYVFTGQAGDVVLISLTSPDFDTYLHLRDTDGNEVASDDDSGEGNNSQIGPFTLPSTGGYTIEAASFGGSSLGDFTLKLDKVELVTLNYGDSAVAEFTRSGQMKYFSFTGRNGDLVTISATSNSGSIDTSLMLNDPYNSQIATDDDGGPGVDPEIYQQLLTQDGTYTIVLQAVSGSSGSVTVSIDRTSPPSLDEGEQTLDFSSSQSARAVGFTANAGETVALTLTSASDGIGSPNVSVMQDGETIANASSNTVQSLSFSFVTPSDGEIIIQINDYSYSSVSYTVSLERMGE